MDVYGFFVQEATSLLCAPLIRLTSSFSKKMFHALSAATDADPSILMVRYARMAKPRLDPSSKSLLPTSFFIIMDDSFERARLHLYPQFRQNLTKPN